MGRRDGASFALRAFKAAGICLGGSGEVGDRRTHCARLVEKKICDVDEGRAATWRA